MNRHSTRGFGGTYIVKPRLSLPLCILLIGPRKCRLPLNACQVKHFSILSQDYPLLCRMVHLPLQKFCDICKFPYQAWKQRTIHSHLIPNKHAQIFDDLRDFYDFFTPYIKCLSSGIKMMSRHLLWEIHLLLKICSIMSCLSTVF